MIGVEHSREMFLTAIVAAFLLATLLGAALANRGFPLPEGERVGHIDGLRGYVALAVVAHHFIIWCYVSRSGAPWGPPALNFFNQLGAGGVSLFFMVTGLVFYPRVLAGLRGNAWPKIYISRVFRIVPLLSLTIVAVTVIVMERTGNVPNHTYPWAFINWIFGRQSVPLLGYPAAGQINAHVLWSLYYEWIFYLLVLPACAALRSLIGNRLPTLAVPIILLVLSGIGRMATTWAFFNFLPLFAFGMLAFECRTSRAISKVLASHGAAIIAIAALGVGMVLFPVPWNSGLPFFGFFFTCIACGNSLFGILATKGARVLGECSYGIYLVHGIVLSVLFVDAARITRTVPTTQLVLVWMPVIAGSVVLITALTYLVVERPAIVAGSRLGKWVSMRRTAPSPAEAEVAP